MATRSTRRTVVGTLTTGGAAALLGASGSRASSASAQDGGQATPAAGTPTAPPVVTPMAGGSTDELKALWERWSALWNGDLAVADEIIAPEFVAHFVPAGDSPGEVRGPDGLKTWIGGSSETYTDYSVTTIVGPLVEGDMMAGRWVIRGTYQGGIPGSAPDAVGRQISFEGTDLLRAKGGQLVEYWVSSDTLNLLQQLGVIPS